MRSAGARVWGHLGVFHLLDELDVLPVVIIIHLCQIYIYIHMYACIYYYYYSYSPGCCCCAEILIWVDGMCLYMQAADAAVPAQFEHLITVNKGSDALGKFTSFFKIRVRCTACLSLTIILWVKTNDSLILVDLSWVQIFSIEVADISLSCQCCCRLALFMPWLHVK